MAFSASHGPVDQALDAFHDPAPAVSELVETQAQQGGLGGTSLEEADTTRLVETNLQNTLSDLDGARYDEIRERAEAFRASYPEGSFLSAEQLDDLRNGLQDATSFEDVTSLMSPFLARYEISFQIDADQGGSLDQAKQLAKGIIDVLNIFPAQPITLENRLSDNQPTSANTQNLFRLNSIVMTTEGVGLHSGKYDSRVIFLNISKASQAIDLLSDSGTLASPSQQGTFAHELGHSVLHDMPLSSSFVEDDYSYLRAVIGFFGGAIDYRTTPSSYSLTNPEEERAEKYRELFTIGIEDPNNVIAFNSPFNKRLLESLAYFESVMPGFSDQLVEQTTLEHASDSSVPLIDGFYRYTVFSGLLLSLYVNRDKVSSKNILRRADLDGPDPGK